MDFYILYEEKLSELIVMSIRGRDNWVLSFVLIWYSEVVSLA